MLENVRNAATGCLHTHVDRRTIKSEFFRREFLAEADVCRSCGVSLWTAGTQTRFSAWVLDLKKERRDVFQLQFYLAESARRGLADMLERFPGIPSASLMRVMVTVYISSHIRYPEFREVSHRVGERIAYRTLILGRRQKTSVQFSPMALLDIQSWSQILKLAPHKVLEDAVFKMLALSTETDPGLREFWEKSLLPQVELFLRAV